MFRALWDRIALKTVYRLDFETDLVVSDAVRRINKMDSIEPVKFRVTRSGLAMSRDGLTSDDARDLG